MDTTFSTILFQGLLSFLLLTSSLNLEGQSRAYRQFSTQKVDRQFRLSDESIAERRQAIERHVKQFQLNGALPNFTIPILFHHIYQDNPIDPVVIEAQLNALNTAFQYQHDWQHPAHDILGIDNLTPPSAGIQFCLADVDLMGDGSIGYNYQQVSVNEWTIDGLVATALGENSVAGFDFTAFKPDNYLNVWIVDLPSNEAGYAQMPWGPKNSDGIVINRQIFEPIGNDFNAYKQGKTLVHLVGSYLGLLELWNENKPCTDDRVFDTPIHNAPNYGPNSEYRNISLCQGNPVEQTMNFMDATDDNNMYLFTQGQMLRVVAMLSEGGPRNSLKDAANLCSRVNVVDALANSRNKSSLDKASIPAFQITPNPAKDQITITFPIDSHWQSFQLFNASGQLLQTLVVDAQTGTLKVDCSGYLPGLYFITANNDGLKQTQKFTLLD